THRAQHVHVRVADGARTALTGCATEAPYGTPNRPTSLSAAVAYGRPHPRRRRCRDPLRPRHAYGGARRAGLTRSRCPTPGARLVRERRADARLLRIARRRGAACR